MRLARLDWFSRIDGARVEWFDSLSDAHRRLAALLVRRDEVVAAGAQMVDIPTADRAELRDWLNANLRSANP